MPIIWDDKPHQYSDVIIQHPELQGVYDELLDNINQNGVPKLGRWAYCKYCYKNVLPVISFGDGLVVCSECTSGLAPLEKVIKAGGYKKWEAQLESYFHMSGEVA